MRHRAFLQLSFLHVGHGMLQLSGTSTLREPGYGFVNSIYEPQDSIERKRKGEDVPHAPARSSRRSPP